MYIAIIVGGFPEQLSWSVFEKALRRSILEAFSPHVRGMDIWKGTETRISIDGEHDCSEVFHLCGMVERVIANLA